MDNNNHALHQTDLSLEMQVLNISVNMARIGNWIEGLNKLKTDKGVEIYQSRFKLIEKMVIQTESYLKDLNNQNLSDRFQKTIDKFTRDFNKFKIQSENIQIYSYLTEKALTWANILQHRAKLA